ncbi:hypothetical protein [Chelatococcus sp. XZ-Ab1]|uniref:carph-isopro domain-containing protein n=1 Tax=Chelatococcus sp. XZ-Ab1 TaxID=3034027 RepID=UPI0023E3AE21|nr:hypothetical protein [Chelatococcus sp. XZ-Ab1]
MFLAMQTIADIFDAFGGSSAVARVLGVGASTASEMKRRGNIPPKYWMGIVEGAKRLDLPGVTYEALAKIHAGAVGGAPGSVSDQDPQASEAVQ